MSLKIVGETTHRTSYPRSLDHNWRLPGGGPLLNSAQNKLFTHLILVRPSFVSRISARSKDFLVFTTWELPPEVSVSEGTWVCAGPGGEWTVLTKDGLAVSPSGLLLVDTTRTLAIHTNGFLWNQTTQEGGKSFEDQTFLGGQQILPQWDNLEVPTEPYAGMEIVREGGIDGRGRVTIWSQQNPGAPVNWWRCDLTKADPSQRAIMHRKIKVGEGRVLWDAHPTLEAFVVAIGKRFEAYGDGWRKSLNGGGYRWLRLTPLPDELSGSKRFEDAWGRRLYVQPSESSAKIDCYQDYQ